MSTPRFILLIALATAFAACKNAEGPVVDANSAVPARILDFTFEPGKRFGPIVSDSASRSQVLALYGDSAVLGTIFIGEGYEEEAVILFPDNPRRRAELYYNESYDTLRPSFIRITGNYEEGEEMRSDWTSTNGLSIGTSIGEVEKINGQPFTISGFGWDYGGQVVNWNGGAFAAGFSPSFLLTAEGEETPMELLGDGTELKSDDPTLRKARPVVISISTDLGRTPPNYLGRWRSVADPEEELEFQPTQVLYYRAGSLTLSNKLEFLPGCQETACGFSGAGGTNEFCLIEKGEFDVQCHVIIRAFNDTLQYFTMGLDGEEIPTFVRQK
ncbi:hypothetical protein QWY85_06930 [Neolewinella lacunae]|uniref:Lipoprotein n=1 Tax=Neolewinella lacunae TaxID=1517758 RepID=A0A923PIG9_9BACT|nr:hypothetical protein [Neolewinella lacunae]MBC6994763.1 hypothetical protein [Neolewinella lacunae]MDN3634385.1 hypothetical protein [Neolewinella lacunae]